MRALTHDWWLWWLMLALLLRNSSPPLQPAAPPSQALPLLRSCSTPFSDSVVVYELALSIDSFAKTLMARSDMLLRVAEGFRGMGVRIGASATDIRIVAGGDAALGGIPAPSPVRPVGVA